MRKIDFSSLKNGVRVVTEHWPDAKSASIGVWIDAGSRDEPPHPSGVAHFLEHLLAQGTERFSGAEISERIDAMGAEINPFTTREHTCLFARVRDEDVFDALELLLELLSNPALDESSIENERKVILEELRANEVQGEQVAYEKLFRCLFRDHPVSRPILGDPNSPN